MWKNLRLFAFTLMAVVAVAFPTQKEKPNASSSPPAKAPTLTDEEKEIMKHREMLENLDLLKNLEQIKYLDFFADKKAGKSKEKPGTKPTIKDNANKNVR